MRLFFVVLRGFFFEKHTRFLADSKPSNMNFRSLIFLFLVFAFIASCKYTQKITTGKMAFERMQYAVAVDLLQKEYKKEESRVEKGKLAFMLGESYKKMNKPTSSISWYKTAFDNQYGVDALKEYAYGLKKNEQYQEAMGAFKELGIEIGSPYEYRKEITACKIAIDWKKQGKERAEYEIELAKFNSTSAEYAPTMYEGNQLVITSDRSASTGDDTYNWTGNNFSDLFIVNPNSNSVEAFDKNINTPNNEGTVCFNNDFTEMYFTRCFDEEDKDYFCKLMMSTREGNSWSVPIVLNFTQQNINYGHPALSEDGGSLYFAANHPEGWGGYDIYVSERTPDGWDEPRLLGRNINTPADEKFPSLDGDTLYFSSEGHTGMGGLDIFKTYKTNKNKWAPPHNLKAPINSGADDFGFVIDPGFRKSKDEIKAGYFSSSRVDGEGNDDIYRFVKVVLPPLPKVEEPPKEIVYKMILEGYVLEKIFAEAGNPNSKVLGRKPLGDSKVDIMVGNTKKTVTVGEDGMFSLELDEETDYNFFASHEGYLNNSERFSSKGIAKDPNNPITKYEVEIVLDKIFKDKEITLENIYYDFDQWFIRDDAKPTLNELANTLLENPTVRIEMASHTDCRGNPGYNRNLSQKRAQSAVDYLIERGVAIDRLEAKGYGENAPAVDCLCSRCTEVEHQANRRTTFKVVD